MQTRPLSRQSGRRFRRQIPILITAGALISAVAVAGCSSSGGDDSSGSGGGTSGASDTGSRDVAGPVPAAKPVDGVAGAGSDYAFESGVGGSETPGQQPIVTGPALIKTATVDLKADDIQSLIDKIYGLALTTGGRVDSEQTSTDSEGTVDHSRLELRVPVARFDDVVDRIYNSAPEHTKNTATEDVTAQLADVTSRVASARASIVQLRKLFDQATALGQVIRLERELSNREADLEALQAQQRSISAQAAMSTIMVTITLPPPVATVVKSDDHQAGFVSGIKKGWDAAVTFVVGTSHALGLVLPLGVLAAVVCLAAWPLARRFSARRPGAPQPSE